MSKDLFISFITNKILIAALASVIISQLLKVLTFFLSEHKVKWDRLFGDGGMPSSHSATVSAATTMTGLLVGFDSPLFAIILVFAIIVMHDASGVRYQSGKHAKAINEMQNSLEEKLGLPDKADLKEFIGHTRLQVFCGCLLGVIVAFIVNAIY